MAKMALILNVALGLVVIAGGLASYQYGNFGGISFDELTEKYISKNDVKFSDLPNDVQKQYIDKEAMIEQSKDGNLYEDTYYDDQGKLIAESDLTKQDLKRTINKLQKTLLFVQHDNLLMSNEKNELSKKLEDQENELEEQRNQLIDKSTERLNEAEQQHYRNINDLTIKINELQKENVLISQKSNMDANALNTQIENLKAKMVEEEEKKQADINTAREEERAKLTDYKNKIELLNDQISLLNEQIATNNETAKNAFIRKQEEIAKLKEEITQVAKEKNEIMNKQTQALIANDQKHKEEIAQYTKAIEQLKGDTEKLIAQNRQDMAAQDEDHAKKMATQEENLKAANTELVNTKKHIDTLMLENEKDFNKFRTYLEDEKKRNSELAAANKTLEERAQINEKNVNASLLTLKEEIAKRENTIKDLNTTIISLNKEKANFEIEVKKRIDENNQGHNKNYKIFNEKIANFDASQKELVAKLDKQMKEYKATLNENNERIQLHVDDLTASNNELKTQYSEKEKELQSLKTKVIAFNAETQKTQESNELKQKELQTIIDDLKAKESAYTAKIQSLQTDNKEKESIIANSKKEEGLKFAALEKEIKAKAIELQRVKMENARHEGALQTMQVKLKDAEDNAIKATNKNVEELKAKVATYEKNRANEEAKMVGLKEDLRRKESEYTNAIKEKDKELKAKEATIVANKESYKKTETLKASGEDALAKLKEEYKQKELQHAAEIKALQNDIKAKESQLASSSKEETLKSAALEKELKAREATIVANKENYKKTEALKASLEDTLAKLKEEFKQKELQHLETTKTLQAELKAKEGQLGSSQKDELLKIAALEKEIKTKENALTLSQDTFNKRIAANEQTIQTLNEKIKLLESTPPKPNVAKTATSKGKKLSMIDKVTCTDMGTGVDAISETCKKEVQTFLAKYDSSYFFEVASVVDNGGFASLKLIKSKKVGVEDAEIDRITGLANIGLGKARAKVGGELVESYIGEGAKISYALSNIEQDKARGFQIRVYH